MPKRRERRGKKEKTESLGQTYFYTKKGGPRGGETTKLRGADAAEAKVALRATQHSGKNQHKQS